MPAHRFKVEIAGQSLHGIAFSTEAELDEFLGHRTLPTSIAAPSPAAPLRLSVAHVSEPRGRGRPKLDSVIGEAVTTLGSKLSPKTPIGARVRLVQKQVAATRGPTEVPGATTVRRYLIGRDRQKSRRN